VPSSAIERYKTTAPWNSFGTIMALTDEDAIGKVNADTATDMEFYDLVGRQIVNCKSSNRKLPKGINIIRYSDGTIKKVRNKYN